MKKRILIFGNHEIGCRTVEMLDDAGYCIVGVLPCYEIESNAWYRSIEDVARDRHLPVLPWHRIRSPEALAGIRALAPDLIISVYYRQIITPEIIAVPTCGAVNLHSSLLPMYRGRFPLFWSILNGETRTGMTLHHIDAGIDTGRIIAQREIHIGPDEGTYDLQQKAIEPGLGLIREWLNPLLDAGVPGITQDGPSTYYGARTVPGGSWRSVEWYAPATNVMRLVRALKPPYPCAATYSARGELSLRKAMLGEPSPGGRPGLVIEASCDGFTVAAGDACVRVTDWRGPIPQPGEVLQPAPHSV